MTPKASPAMSEPGVYSWPSQGEWAAMSVEDRKHRALVLLKAAVENEYRERVPSLAVRQAFDIAVMSFDRDGLHLRETSPDWWRKNKPWWAL
jgi:hypothetical protein